MDKTRKINDLGKEKDKAFQADRLMKQNIYNSKNSPEEDINLICKLKRTSMSGEKLGTGINGKYVVLRIVA